MKNKVNIGILLGDPSGIGPELISKLLSKKELNEANIVVIGEKGILEDANNLTKQHTDLKYVNNFDDINFDNKTKFFLDVSKGKNSRYEKAKCSFQSGKSVLDSLNLALDLAKSKKIDAINFAPFNKTSMKLGGSKYEDELHLMADKLDVKIFFVNLM